MLPPLKGGTAPSSKEAPPRCWLDSWPEGHHPSLLFLWSSQGPSDDDRALLGHLPLAGLLYGPGAGLSLVLRDPGGHVLQTKLCAAALPCLWWPLPLEMWTLEFWFSALTHHCLLVTCLWLACFSGFIGPFGCSQCHLCHLPSFGLLFCRRSFTRRFYFSML